MNVSVAEEAGKFCTFDPLCRCELTPTSVDSARPSLHEKSRSRQSSISTHPDAENSGDLITQTQQCRILGSTCLMAFTLVGLNQAFGVFQAHYGREAAAIEGVLLQAELFQRPLISAIGSLGNGGLFAAFGVFYYPHLPQLGGHIRYLCGLGTVFVAIGFAAAVASHKVSKGSQLLSR